MSATLGMTDHAHYARPPRRYSTLIPAMTLTVAVFGMFFSLCAGNLSGRSHHGAQVRRLWSVEGGQGAGLGPQAAVPTTWNSSQFRTPEPAPPPGALPLKDVGELWGEHAVFEGWQVQRYWNMDALQVALSPAANTAQLRPVLEALYAGRPITVVAIGSSVVSGYAGAFQASLDTVFRRVRSPSVESYGVGKGRGRGWVELFMRYVNDTWPHPEHLLINAGRGGTSPALFADGACLEHMLPEEADVVIIETMAFIDALSLERLIWRLLRHFRASHASPPPAVIILNSVLVAATAPSQGGWGSGGRCRLPPHGNFSDCCQDYTDGINLALRPQIAADERNAATNGSPSEGVHHDLARYYGFASISHRDFLWQYIKVKAWKHMGTVAATHGQCWFVALTQTDWIHPSRLGTVLYADYLWAYFSRGNQDYAQDLELRSKAPTSSVPPADLAAALHPLSQALAGSSEPSQIPPGPFQPAGRDVYTMRCYGVAASEGSVVWTPTWGHTDMGDVASLPIVASQGFEFMVNTTHGNPPKRKPGWVATAPGAFMEVEVDTQFAEISSEQMATHQQEQGSPAPTAATAAAKTDIVVVFLLSYEHMGRAAVSCIAGCFCERTEIEAHHDTRTSVAGLAALAVTQARQCRLRVEVVEGTSSGEHKFKVTQVLARAKASHL